MELLPGGTLKDRVAAEGPLAPAVAVSAVLDIIGGLDAAQAAGILHRDIKPSNCFVDSDGSAMAGQAFTSSPAARGRLAFVRARAVAARSACSTAARYRSNRTRSSLRTIRRHDRTGRR
jgi:serine/threonine protein kinase